MPNFERCAEDERVFLRDRGGDTESFTQHRVQSKGQLGGGTHGDGRMAGGDEVMRNRAVLKLNLQGQGGVPKPAFLSRFRANARRQREEA
jgi:hypothetical protein